MEADFQLSVHREPPHPFLRLLHPLTWSLWKEIPQEISIFSLKSRLCILLLAYCRQSSSSWRELNEGHFIQCLWTTKYPTNYENLAFILYFASKYSFPFLSFDAGFNILRLAQTGHKLRTLLPLPPEDWDCKLILPCLVVCIDRAVENCTLHDRISQVIKLLNQGKVMKNWGKQDRRKYRKNAVHST